MNSRREGHTYTERTASAAAALLLGLCLGACTEPKPTTYPMNTVLPFGKIEMSVQGTEASSEGSHKSVAVRVRMNNLESQSQARVASQSWQQFFKLVDSNGKKYRCRYILPTDYYYKKLAENRDVHAWGSTWADENAPSTPRDWVLIFTTDLDAQGLTLFINNATFGTSNQPLSIAVPLDR